MKQALIAGTAGHIDHGKTALVKALTGVDTDRLPEEKARGITIDIGFAHTVLNGVELSFIDVPGHERFVKNMLAGMGGIDLLLLIVAADESVMPQTREHFDICRLLEIRSGVVVITKKDLASEEMLQTVQAEITDLVRGSFLENAPVFVVSSRTGEGVDALKTGLAQILKKLPSRESDGPFRLPVDRVFTIKGQGTIVTGTLVSGGIHREDLVVLQPSGVHSRVRSIHAHDQRVEIAIAGQRTALNLQGLEKQEIQRGEVVTAPNFLQPTSLLDVEITLLQNSKPVIHNSLLRLHHQTADTLARITLLGKTNLLPGETAFAQLRLQKPLLALYGDRFIVRKHSPLMTIGGGVILDHLPLRRTGASDPLALERLAQLRHASAPLRLSLAVRQKGIQGAGESFLKAKLGMTRQEILSLQAPDVIFLRQQPVLAVSTESENELIGEIGSGVADFHKKQPLLPGISKEELRTRVLPHIPAEVFHTILERSSGKKIIQIHKDLISSYGRTIQLSGEEEALKLQIEERFAKTALETPSGEELARDLKQNPQKIKNILHLLIRETKLTKITDDYFLHVTNWRMLIGKIQELKTKQKTLSVPDFKNVFGVTRKYAIPLLEMLDREGITRRSGNDRIIL